MLTPAWLSIVLRFPFMTYMAGYPLWHLVTTMERCWATLRAHDYERSSCAYGIISSVCMVHRVLFVQE